MKQSSMILLFNLLELLSKHSFKNIFITSFSDANYSHLMFNLTEELNTGPYMVIMYVEQNISIESFHASCFNFHNVSIYVKWQQKIVMSITDFWDKVHFHQNLIEDEKHFIITMEISTPPPNHLLTKYWAHCLPKYYAYQDYSTVTLTFNCMLKLNLGNNTLESRILQICYTTDQPAAPVYSTGNVMTIQFISSSLNTDRGFQVSVSAKMGVYFCDKKIFPMMHFSQIRSYWWLLLGSDI